jgi:hypothetical protein
MEDQPFVSVIMNCLDGEKCSKEAIDSVNRQTYQNWKILRGRIEGQLEQIAIYITMFFPYEFALLVQSLVTNRTLLPDSPRSL